MRRSLLRALAVIVLTNFISIVPLWAGSKGLERGNVDGESLIATLQAIFRKVDTNTMPCWCDKGFSKAVAPYVTPALISAVAYGGRIAHEKSIDLYDAEFFTGRQELHSVQIKHADVVHYDREHAAVRTQLLINAAYPKWPQPLPITYVFRRIDGAWKIDDIEWATGEPSVKTHFMHP